MKISRVVLVANVAYILVLVVVILLQSTKNLQR